MTMEYKGYNIEIKKDEYPENPRDNDNTGVMACFHGRYNLGDKHNFKSGQFSGWDEMKDYLIKEEKAVVILPLYLYDHSGITIKTSPFSCPWDSGQVGFIYATKESIIKNWSVKKITKKMIEKITNCLEAEVKEYDSYLTGDCYGYIVKKGEEEVDSCWGYMGGGVMSGNDYALEEAKSVVDSILSRVKA